MNISSENIKVFPFGTDRPTDPYARILNEQNIIRIFKNIVDNDSYVINYDYSDNIIEFMLCGYYFKAKLDDVWSSEKKNPLYAIIQLVQHSDYYHLSGGDESNGDTSNGGESKSTIFKGVTFSYEKPTNEGTYLQLFNKDGTIPESSRLKFNNIDVINCGTSTELV